MSTEANSDGEYDYYAAEAREEAQAAAARGNRDDVEVVAILSDEEDEEEQGPEHQEHDRSSGQGQEDEEEEEYEYPGTSVCEREEEQERVRLGEAAAAAAAAASVGTGAEDEDNLSDMSGDYNMSQESNYEYEMSDDEAGGTAQGKNLAEADAEAFVEGTDGMFAMVEAPSSHLVRLWICVKPWRLYEGLGSRTVEALGLDPLKGVAVMLTTDQYYTLSSKCPEVRWVTQIEPDAMDAVATCSDGSIGDTFPLQWMLRKRLEETLHKNWPPRSRFPDDDDGGGHDGDNNDRDERGASGAASGGSAAGRSGGTDPDSEVVRFAIESIREVTGVPAELAAYALRFSQYDEQLAQNNLLDEGTRASLEMTLKEDRSAAVAELKKTFPLVDEAIVTRAVSAHPGALHLQRNFICRVETGEQQHPSSSSSPPPPSPPASHVAAQQQKQQQQQQAATSSSAGAGGAGAAAAPSGGSMFKFRKWGALKRPSPASAGGARSAEVDGKGRAGADGGDVRGASRGGSGRGKERPQQGWEGKGDLGYMPVDLTEDEEREDRRAMLEHLSDKNLLLRVALTVIDKLRNANKNCLVCDDKIEGFLPAVPIVCPKDLCVMSSEDMGCGTDVESQVSRKGETVDLLVDLFYMAMEGNRSELSFPDAVQYGSGLAFKGSDGKNDVAKVRRVLNILPSVEDMQRCIERKKNGRGGGISFCRSKTEVEEAGEVWNPATFVTSASSANCPLAALNAAANAASALANSAAATAAAAAARNPGSTAARIAKDNLAAAKLDAKKAADAATSFQASGNAGAAAGAAAGAGAGDGRGDADWDHPDAQVLSLREALSERDPLAYVLLRWLLSANRAHLRPLRGSELIQEIPCFKQFMLVTGTAEREARFQTMKRSAAKNGGTGSFFAFHGSRPENWHGILHMGLKNMSGTKFMSAGAAYGRGIYMADQLSVSLQYANRGASGGHWPLAKTKGEAVILAVCEVIDNEQCRKEHGPSKFYVIQEEECVATRFLLINPKVSGRSLSSPITAKQLAIGNQMR